VGKDGGMSTSAAEWKARPEGPDYEAVRLRLVDAAEQIILDQGAASLRLDSVGEAVGLHRSSVYRYFDSKEDLLTAVIMQATLRLAAEVVESLGVSARADQFLVDGLAMAMARITNEPVHRSLMAPASEAMTRVGARALTEGLRPLVEPMFVAAAEQGVLREGVTTEDALRWLLIVATGLFRAPDVVPSVDELTRLLELMLVPVLLDASEVERRRSHR
jgi:AcrR family transcriptional regulator